MTTQCTECPLPWDDHTEAMREACRAGRVATIEARRYAATHEHMGVVEMLNAQWAYVSHACDDVEYLLAENARLQRLAADQDRANTRLLAEATRNIDELRGWRLAFGKRAVTDTGIDDADTMLPVLGAVVREIWNATCRHGSVAQQALPLGIGTPDAVAYEALAKQRCDIARANGTITWSHVLDEEAAEVMGAKTPADARKEALQVACVAIRIVQAIDLGAGK